VAFNLLFRVTVSPFLTFCVSIHTLPSRLAKSVRTWWVIPDTVLNSTNRLLLDHLHITVCSLALASRPARGAYTGDHYKRGILGYEAVWLGGCHHFSCSFHTRRHILDNCSRYCRVIKIMNFRQAFSPLLPFRPHFFLFLPEILFPPLLCLFS